MKKTMMALFLASSLSLGACATTNDDDLADIGTGAAIGAGVGPERLAVVGFGEHQPVADNATVEGRNANRRVLLVILAAPQGPDAVTERMPPVMADAGDVQPLFPLPDAASGGSALGAP